jgi:ribulose 1,5-bisphosphate synthetase/thiazole synthase
MTTIVPATAAAQGTQEIQDAGHVDVLVVGAGVSGIGAAHHRSAWIDSLSATGDAIQGVTSAPRHTCPSSSCR